MRPVAVKRCPRRSAVSWCRGASRSCARSSRPPRCGNTRTSRRRCRRSSGCASPRRPARSSIAGRRRWPSRRMARRGLVRVRRGVPALRARPRRARGAAPFAGTDDAAAPFFSPDGRWVGFFAAGKLRKVALAGGLPVALTDAAAAVRRRLDCRTAGSFWRVGARRAHARQRSRRRRRAADAPSAAAGEVRHAWPALAPGGRALLFTIATSPLEARRAHRGDAARRRQDRVADRSSSRRDIARAASPTSTSRSRAAASCTRPRSIASRLTIARARAGRRLGASRAAQFAHRPAPDRSRTRHRRGGVAPALEWSPPSRGIRRRRPPELGRRLRGRGALSGRPSASRASARDRTAPTSGSATSSAATTTRLTHGGQRRAGLERGRRVGFLRVVRRRPVRGLDARRVGQPRRHKQVLSGASRQRTSFRRRCRRDGRLIASPRAAVRRAATSWSLPLSGGAAQPLDQHAVRRDQRRCFRLTAVCSPISRTNPGAGRSTCCGWLERAPDRRVDRRRHRTRSGRRTDAGLFFHSGDRLVRATVSADCERQQPVGPHGLTDARWSVPPSRPSRRTELCCFAGTAPTLQSLREARR